MSEPDPAEIKQILAELRDYNKERRRTAVMKLGMAGGEEAVTALILAVQNRNEDLIVRGRAALMLGKLGSPRAVLPLIRALDAPGLQTPLNAAQALGKLGDPRAIKPLLIMASSADPQFRAAALEALERLGYSQDAGEPQDMVSEESEA
jgi:HEAT repeat protein